MNKDRTISQEKERAQKILAHRDSFIARNYWLWVMVAFIFYPLAAIFSACTEGGHVYIRMKTSMGDGAMPLIITLLLVLLIEGLKFFLGKGAVDDIQAGVFSEGGSFLAAFALKVMGFIAVLSYSIFLSVQGAPEVSAYLRTHFTPVENTYLDTDEIRARYETELQPHRENIATYQNTTWKGKIVSEARKMILAEQAMMASIEQRRAEELSKATQENEARKQQYDERTAANGSWAMSFAGLGEVVCIFCLIFIGIYDDGLTGEVLKGQTTTQQATPPPHHQPAGYYQIPANTNVNQTPTTHSQRYRRNQIGFRLPEATQQSPSPPPANYTVATGSYQVATPDDSNSDTSTSTTEELPLTAKTLIKAYRKTRSDYQAWASKLANGQGRSQTNEKHMKKLTIELSKIAQELREQYNVDISQHVKKRV